MEHLGEAFGQAVGQRFQQDVRIIVVLGLESREMRLETVDADREAADPVLAVGLMKSARHMFGRPSRFFTCWRRKGRRVQSLPASTRTSSPSRLQRHRPTVAFGVSQRSAMIRSSIALRVVEQVAGAFADDLVVEDRRIIAGQLPGAEEGRPVDRSLEVAERPFAEMVEARARGGGAWPEGRRRSRWRGPRRATRSSLWPLRARDLRSAS